MELVKTLTSRQRRDQLLINQDLQNQGVPSSSTQGNRRINTNEFQMKRHSSEYLSTINGTESNQRYATNNGPGTVKPQTQERMRKIISSRMQSNAEIMSGQGQLIGVQSNAEIATSNALIGGGTMQDTQYPQTARGAPRRNLRSLLGEGGSSQSFNKLPLYGFSKNRPQQLSQGYILNSDYSTQRFTSAKQTLQSETLSNNFTFSLQSSVLQSRALQQRTKGGFSDFAKGSSHISKLQLKYDEEKNVVKHKRQQIEKLQSELEQLRLNNQGKEENQGIASPTSSQPMISPSQKVMDSLMLQSLRPTLANLGSQLTSSFKNFGTDSLSKQISSPRFTGTVKPQNHQQTIITNAPNLWVNLYMPYYPMCYDDETITVNLTKIKDDLQKQVKDVEFKHKSEFFINQKLVHKQIKEKAMITYLTLKQRELVPDQMKFEKAVETIPRVKMLGATSRELAKNILNQRREQLDHRKKFYDGILQSKIQQLKVESKALDEVKAAMAKRQRRVEEMQEYLKELSTKNHQEESQKSELISSLMNKNLEFKVLSGIEIIKKLETALISVDKLSRTKVEDQQQGMEIMNSIKQGAIQVCDLNHEDFDAMNKKKIEMLQSYQQHFSPFLEDIQSVQINDNYLKKRYYDLWFSINSLCSRFQELAHSTNIKRKLIKQYKKFKETQIRDKQFLDKYREFTRSQTIKREDFDQTLNNMKFTDFTLGNGLINADHQRFKQIIAECQSIVINTLQKNCYILKVIMQFIRVEEPKAKVKDKSDKKYEPIPISTYFTPELLKLISKYSLIAKPPAPPKLEHQEMEASKKSTKLTLKDDKRKTYQTSRFSNSHASLKPASTHSRNKSRQQLQVDQSEGRSTSRLSSSFKRRKEEFSSTYVSNFSLQPLHPLNDNDGLHILIDFRNFFKLLVIDQEHLTLLGQLEQNSFPYKQALKFLKLHPELSKIFEVCSQTRGICELNPPIMHYNALEFVEKHPKIGEQQLDDSCIQGSRQSDNGMAAMHIDEEPSVDEEDYVDPKTKKIITEILLEERNKLEKEEKKRKKQIEKAKKLAMMSEEQRKAQNRLKLQKQMFGLKDFERAELFFRSQFQQTLTQVFQNEVPPDKQTHDYLLLDGSSVVRATGALLKKRDLREKVEGFLGTNEVALTTSPNILRFEHHRTHKTFRLMTQNKKFRTMKTAQNLQSHESLTCDRQQHQANPFLFMGSDGQGKPQSINPQILSRTMVKIDKPAHKKSNVVLSMLQDRFPELQDLFMDTESRRDKKRALQIRQRKNSLEHQRNNPEKFNMAFSEGGPKTHRLNSQNSFSGMNSAGNTINPFTQEDEINIVNTGYTEGGDQFNSNLDLATQGTNFFTEQDQDYLEATPIIKVKPVFPRGKLHN